jgi:hypothetical protein
MWMKKKHHLEKLILKIQYKKIEKLSLKKLKEKENEKND